MTHLIDDVARAMTDAAPPAGLHGAVLARLDRRRPVRFWWITAPIAAAALVALAIGLRHNGTTPGTASSVPAIAKTGPVTSDRTPAAHSDPAGDSFRAPARPRRQPAPALHVRTIPALNEPAALDSGAIQPDGLDIPLLQLKPIVTEPIAIKVIGDDTGGRESSPWIFNALYRHETSER